MRWANWSRKDHTNTTWETDVFPDLVDHWEQKQCSKRNVIAQESLDIEVAWPDDAVHNRFTFLHAQALEEKKLRYLGGIPSAADWDEEIEHGRN